ncbi:MAG TPA: squalene--hopene cyclase, partial [Anaerolineae bacterium]|nr:squalene--hopene cyclase [Anaerolineae bacterium]
MSTTSVIEQQALATAIRKAQGYLLARQSPAGYWVGELEADASVAAGYTPLMYLMLGQVDPRRAEAAVRYVLGKQRPDGSWSAYHGGAGDLGASIQCYLSLKLSGLPPDDPALQRAREFILAKGGICKANVFTKVWLALFGQYDWRGVPSVPPELILLPNWFYVNIYEFASWSRATIVALMVVLTLKPVCLLPSGAGVEELYAEPPAERDYSLGTIDRLFSWRSFFLVADRLLKGYERLHLKPLRRRALAATARWIEAHQEADGSWGGIMLPWIYSLAALKALGYPLDHPAMARGLAGIEGFIVEDEAGQRMQPAVSPVWDTAWAVVALAESGLGDDHDALRRAAGWLLEQEIRCGGDWQVKNPATASGCWAFEFENDAYPDMDDTALVCRALQRVRLAEGEAARAEAIERGLAWMADMQSRDGGWAAFDRDNDRTILEHVPFADFMSPLDPTCADVTAHVVELLGELGRQGAMRDRALAYLAQTQEPDGAWYGRWGVNYVYGTGLVLAATSPLPRSGRGVGGEGAWPGMIARAVAWLNAHQNGDGGWGETCQTYDDPSLRGTGPSTPSQTAWALMGLIAAGQAATPAVQAGVRYLLDSQAADGSWPEAAYTGTGFPRAFYLRYGL